MSSNITGTSNALDLINLVSNLQSSVNNVTSAFTNISNNINSLNQYDTLNTTKIN